MSIVKQTITQTTYPVKFTEMNESVYKKMYVEFEHISHRCMELARENEELMQRSQVTVKKVETNIVEKREGMSHEAAERITELEVKLDHTELELKLKIREIEELTIYVTKFHELETKVAYLHEEKAVVKADLCDRIRELEEMRNEKIMIEQINEKNILVINDKNRDIETLYRRIEELELLPPLFKQAKQDIQFLTSEVERLTILLKEREFDMINMSKTIEILTAERCLAPAEHEELKFRTAENVQLRDKVLAIPTLQEVIVALEVEIKKLQFAFAESEALTLTQKFTIDELHKKIESLNEAIGFRDLAIAELEQYRSESIIEIERIKIESNERLMLALGEKDQIISELTMMIDNLKKEVFLFNQEIEALKKNYETLMLERDSLLKILNTRDSQISILTEANLRKDEQLEKYTSQFDEACKKISCLENEISNLKTQLAMALTESQNLMIRIGELEEYKRYYEEVVIDRDAKVLEIKELMLQNTRLIADIDTLRSELIALRTKYEDLRILCDKVTIERDVKIAELMDALAVNKSMAAKISEYEIELESRNRKINELSARLRDAELLIVTLTQKVEVLEHDMSDLEIKYEAVKSENHRLIETVKMMTIEKEHLVTLVDQRDSLIAALNKDVVRLTDDNKHLTATIVSLKEKCDGLEAVLHEREVEIEKLRVSRDHLALEIDGLNKKTAFFLSEFDKLEKANKAQDGEIRHLREELSKFQELSERIEDLTLQNAQLRQQLTEIPALRAELVKAQQQIYAAVTEKDRLMEVLRERDEEISNLRFVSREYDELRLRFKESEEEVVRMTALIAQRESFVRELQTKIINLESILDSQKHMVIENERLTVEVPVLISRIQTLEQSLTVTNEKYFKLENLYREIRGVTEHLGEIHEKLVDTVDETARVSESMKQTTTMTQKTIATDKYAIEPTVQRF